MKKIGFCFLIYDIIENEELWNLFFKNVDKNKYKIYIHFKVDKPLKYFEDFKLKNCIETEYGHVSLIHSHNLLFRTAYDDGCYKMINLSQSCIPFKNFYYIYNFLTKDNCAHFNMAPQLNCFPFCNNLLKYYDRESIQKSSEWFILNRKIFESIMNYDVNEINDMYSEIFAPEEKFYITAVYHFKFQNEIITTPNLSNDATTFTNWHDMGYKYSDPDNSGLKNYESISNEEILYLISSKCLFGRKFSKKCGDCLFNFDDYINFITL